MAKKPPVYRMIEHFNYDKSACQSALQIVRSLPLPKGGEKQ